MSLIEIKIRHFVKLQKGVAFQAVQVDTPQGTLTATKECCPNCDSFFEFIEIFEKGLNDALQKEGLWTFTPIAPLVKEIVRKLEPN